MRIWTGVRPLFVKENEGRDRHLPHIEPWMKNVVSFQMCDEGMRGGERFSNGGRSRARQG